ncbi:MAG: methyltransferase domain-containing protein [Cohaesibacter sp.]|jgi:ubiquinone/menaquinone biosynthesis C-methylase UbiE|nr:methyltransferase domain-containing protein [Cohaesibacter sp.]
MNFDLLIDLHKDGWRQGPGSEDASLQALTLAGLCAQGTPRLNIADIGCGTGAASLTLAKMLDADITAIDLFPAFLDILKTRAQEERLKGTLTTLACSMDQLPFEEESLDVIWSEGAIYNIGFEKGVSYFKSFLKQGGILAVSEITWLTHNRPDEITKHWDTNYPEIATSADKISILEDKGFVVKGYFPLSEDCWLENYYKPLEGRFEAFLAKHQGKEAKELIEAEITEIDLYRRYHDYYSYGFYIAQKI